MSRIKEYKVAWYDMEHGGKCFDESSYSPEKINEVIYDVETDDDKNHCDRTRVFVHMDDGDVYELLMKKLSEKQLKKRSSFYGGKKYIEQVANMLGVELYEEFKIRPTEYGKALGYIVLEDNRIFRFDSELVCKGYRDNWSEWCGNGCYRILYYLILGLYEVVKSDEILMR